MANLHRRAALHYNYKSKSATRAMSDTAISSSAISISSEDQAAVERHMKFLQAEEKKRGPNNEV